MLYNRLSALGQRENSAPDPLWRQPYLLHRSHWAAASTRLPGPGAKLPQDPFGGVDARSENQGCANDEIKGAGVDHLSRNHARAVREVDRAVPLGPARTDVVYGGDSANIRHRPKDPPIRYGGNSPHDRGFSFQLV